MDSKVDEFSRNNDGTIDLLRSPDLFLILNTPKGRGVFSRKEIKQGEIVDISPVIILTPEENQKHIEQTSLYHYTYNWTIIRDSKTIKTQAVVLGLGSMFNHSSDQNIGWERDFEKKTITYKAIRTIPAGEELCISYGSRLTFVDHDARPPTPEDASQLLNYISID